MQLAAHLLPHACTLSPASPALRAPHDPMPPPLATAARLAPSLLQPKKVDSYKPKAPAPAPAPKKKSLSELFGFISAYNVKGRKLMVRAQLA